MSISDNFQKLLKNLRTNNDESVSLRYKTITKRLNIDFWNSSSDLYHSKYVGSYGRGTAIKGFSDVDILFELPSAYYYQYNDYTYNGQSALLQAVRTSLQKIYKTSRIGGDGQVVVINFSDNITFEILPTFNNQSGTYTYPDSNNGGTWKTCNPIAEIKSINDANYKYNKKIKDLSRMMKAWKNYNNVPISGMLIETLVMQFMDEWEYNDKSYYWYDYMTRDFLYFLSTRNSDQQYWLARGSNKYVWREGNFEYKALLGYNNAVKAIEYGDDFPSYAKPHWQAIFGSNYEG